MLPYDAAPLATLADELDRWRELLDYRGPLPRAWRGRLRRDLETEAVAASTSMEGVGVTVDEVRRILVGERPSEVTPEDIDLVLGYRDAMGFAMRRADDPNFVWNRELLVTFQDRVLAGKFPLGAGRLRTGAAFVVERTTGRQVFAPPQPEELASLVDQACERMREGHPHPAMAAAWIHVAIAGIHPFRDGNGRAARVSATLGMVRGGFKLPEFTSLEEWWGRHLPDYYGAFETLGATFDAEVDVTPFIEAHMSAQLHQVRALDLREQIERRIWLALEELVERAHLPGRVTNAAWDAFFERDVTSRYYRPLADVGPATAAADLSGAVAAGLLRPIGAGRSRRYGPGEGLFQRVGAELDVEVDDLGETARSTIGVVVAARVASERAGPISPSDP